MIPHMTTFGCLSEGPKGSSRRSSKGWSSLMLECWWLIRWHVVVPSGASSLYCLFSLHTHTQTVTHTHKQSHNTQTRSVCSCLSQRNESPLSSHTIVLPFPSLYLLTVIYLEDGIRAAPTANMPQLQRPIKRGSETKRERGRKEESVGALWVRKEVKARDG